MAAPGWTAEEQDCDSAPEDAPRLRDATREHGRPGADLAAQANAAAAARPPPPQTCRRALAAGLAAEDHRRHVRTNVLGTTAYDRHCQYIRDYVSFYGKLDALCEDQVHRAGRKTDVDVLAEQHRFVWRAGDSAAATWEQRMAKAYYDRLFHEYCIVDLSRYKTGAVGMRWRTEGEVMAGTGQFTCAAVACDAREGLASWEVCFRYKEQGQDRRALVKARLCGKCSKR